MVSSDSEMEAETVNSENIPQAGLPYDKDWTTFADLVNTTNEPWKNFTSVLHKKGDAKHDTLGIFAKLITRSVTVKNENTALSDKCGFTILVSCFRLCTDTHTLPSETANDMLSMMMTEVRHLSTKSLSKSVEYCMDYMKSSGGDLPNRWMELFGKIIAELFQHCGIEFEGDCISGMEYKGYVINALCRLEWGNKNAPTMIAIIRELPDITDQELNTVLTKIENSMANIDPPVLPPLTHQILYLAGNSKPKRVLKVLEDYFSILDNNDGESRGRDKEIYTIRVKALGTVLYYFIEGAKQYEPVTREILKLLKLATYNPELLKSSFTLALVLSLSTQLHLKDPIVEGLINIILSYHRDQNLNFLSTWRKKTLALNEFHFSGIFKDLTKSKIGILDCVAEGLLNLGIGLLNSSKIKRERNYRVAKECWKIGSDLVFAVVTQDKKWLLTVVTELLKYPDIYCIECLEKCFEVSTRQLVSSPMSAKIHELITQFPMMTVDHSAPLIKSLLPAFKLSSSLLDSLLIMTRKAVWKSVQSRLVSLNALILLLSYSPIVNDIPLNNFSQTQSIFGSSQIDEKIARYTGIFDNDSLCFEVMSIIRRFFTLQIEVRQQLYYGLHSVIRRNPELSRLICMSVHTQVQLYMTEDLNAISFDKIFVSPKESSVDPISIEEDLGLLIQCLCGVTETALCAYSDGLIPEPVSQCDDLIVKWIDLVNELKLEDIYDISAQILENVGGSRPVDSSVVFIRNVLIVQFLQVMEVLLEYVLLKGLKGHAQPNSGASKYSKKLFKKIEEFKTAIEAIANNKVKQKGGGKGKGPSKNKSKIVDKNKSNDKDLDLDVTSKSVDEEPKAKKSTMSYSKIMFHHIMSLSSVKMILEDVYMRECNDGSTRNPELKAVRKMVTFEKYLLEVVLEKSNILKQKKCIKERHPKINDVVKELTGIFRVIWKECVSNVKNFMEKNEDLGDDHNFNMTDLQCEILFSIAEIISVQAPDLMENLFDFDEIRDDEYQDHLAETNEFGKQWRLIADLYGCIPNSKTTMAYLLGLLTVVLSSAPKIENRYDTFSEILNWCILFYAINNKDVECHDCQLLENLLQTMFTASNKSGSMNEDFILIAKQAHYKLGDSGIYPPKKGKASWLVHQDTSESVVCALATYIENQLIYANSIVLRMKSQLTDGSVAVAKGRECCQLLLYVVRIASEIVSCAFPVGKSSVAITKLIPKIYIALAGIAEYYCIEIKKTSVPFHCKKFIELAKFAGSKLKVNVEDFITYIETINREKADEIYRNSKAKKKGVYPAVLKRQFANDTKNIPTIVYHLEKYEQHLFTLASKTKVNILAGTKLSTARDFRIRMDRLKQAIAENNKSDREDEPDETGSPNPAPSNRPPNTSRDQNATPRGTGKEKNSTALKSSGKQSKFITTETTSKNTKAKIRNTSTDANKHNVSKRKISDEPTASTSFKKRK